MMLGLDSTFSNLFRQVMPALPISGPADSVVFGTNIRYKPFSLMPLTEDQRFAIDRAKKYALEQNVQNVFSKQAAQLHQHDLVALKRNQALILLSRIYVGSISFEIGEDEIRKTFSPFGPIKSVTMSWDPTLQKHKGYAFVEFEVPEAATLALEQMNGFPLAGRNLKVGRPSNAPNVGSYEAEFRSDEDTRNRVYVASVHPELTPSDLQTVFEAFGKVEYCTLFPDQKFPDRHRGFGYIGFETEETALAAVSSMNCFDLAGQQLRVGRALTPKDSPLPFEAMKANMATAASVSAVALVAASISAKVMSMPAEDSASPLPATAAVPAPTTVTPSSTRPASSGFSDRPAAVPNLPPPGIFIPSAEGPNTAEGGQVQVEESEIPLPAPTQNGDGANVPSEEDHTISPSKEVEQNQAEGFSPPATLEFSRVVLLENMVSSEEVDEYLESEVAEECSNYGTVLHVFVHTTPASEVRIFVQFDRSDSAQLACESLGQRYFAGRLVRAQLFDEERFQLHEFDD